jgi:hypothetical protein
LDYPVLHVCIKPDKTLICQWNDQYDWSKENRFDQGNLMREPEIKIHIESLVQVSIDIIKRYFAETAALPQINLDN